MDGDVAQLVEHRTSMLLMQVWFPCAARDFSARVNFQCRLSYMCPYTPCAMHTLTSVHMLKVHSISEFSGNTKTPSLHHRLDSITLVTAGFPQRKQPEFPMGEITMEQYSCTPPKKKKKKKERKEIVIWKCLDCFRFIICWLIWKMCVSVMIICVHLWQKL